MRLLLDENLPRRLKNDFHGYEIHTVRDKGWQGLKNGALLKKMIDAGYVALLTFDKNLQHQQNFSRYPVAVFVMSAKINSYEVLTNLTSTIRRYLDNPPLPSGAIIIQSP